MTVVRLDALVVHIHREAGGGGGTGGRGAGRGRRGGRPLLLVAQVAMLLLVVERPGRGHRRRGRRLRAARILANDVHGRVVVVIVAHSLVVIDLAAAEDDDANALPPSLAHMLPISSLC